MVLNHVAACYNKSIFCKRRPGHIDAACRATATFAVAEAGVLRGPNDLENHVTTKAVSRMCCHSLLPNFLLFIR